MDTDFGLILDGVILVFLAVTIFYASRLSMFFKSFRQSRSEVEKLIKNLSIVVDKAELALHDMNENAKNADGNLQNLINEANFLSDELRFINETGDNLADRLEKLVARNRELVDMLEDNGGVGRPKIKIDSQGFNHLEDNGWNLEIDESIDIASDNVKPVAKSKPKSKPSKKSHISFNISDRQFEEDDIAEEDNDGGAWSSLEDSEETESLSESSSEKFISQAERDLYDALKLQKKTKIKESA